MEAGLGPRGAAGGGNPFSGKASGKGSVCLARVSLVWPCCGAACGWQRDGRAGAAGEQWTRRGKDTLTWVTAGALVEPVLLEN